MTKHTVRNLSITGVVAGLSGFTFLSVAPIFSGSTTSQANAVCQSTIGQIAQSISNHAVSACYSVGIAEIVKAVLLATTVLSAVLLVWKASQS